MHMAINQPQSGLDMSGLPTPGLELPDLDAILKGGQGGEQPPMPPEGMPPEEPEFAPEGGPVPPPEGLQIPGAPEMPPGAPLSPEASIASKMGKKTEDPEGHAINLISTSIRSLNQLADVLLGSDEANAKTVRQIIKILGEILKNAQHGGTTPVPAE